jgi:hypothetical protein
MEKAHITFSNEEQAGQWIEDLTAEGFTVWQSVAYSDGVAVPCLAVDISDPYTKIVFEMFMVGRMAA